MPNIMYNCLDYSKAAPSLQRQRYRIHF